MGYLLDEDDESAKIKNYLMQKYPDQMPAVPVASVAPEREPSQYEKYQKDFGDEALKAAQAEAGEQKSGLGWAQFGAGIGDAIANAGGGRANAAGNLDQIRKNIDDRTVGAFEKRKDSAMKNIATKKTLDGGDRNSQSSTAFRKSIEANFPATVKQYGDKWQFITADDQENLFKPLQLKENIEARKEQARILAGDRSENRAQRLHEKQEKLDEKSELLQTSYGKARTPDDAKQIKEAAVLKKSFDNKLDELIQIRGGADGKGGGQVLDRTAVARAKQLSKDLLLDYKSLSGLGVLSQSDMTILNAIIPDDPLQYRSPMEVMSGQDATLSKMKSFKEDKNKDFENRLAERLRNPAAGIAKVEATRQMPKQERVLVKTQTNKQTGEKRAVYSDGTFEILNPVVGGK